MSDTLILPSGWKPVAHPPSLFRRYEFASYGETREFLDRLLVLSHETRLFPDLGFGKTHVNVTLHGADGKAPGDAELEFASRASLLASEGLV
jgi:pterin-4a-carbinolamine dehydratase